MSKYLSGPSTISAEPSKNGYWFLHSASASWYKFARIVAVLDGHDKPNPQTRATAMLFKHAPDLVEAMSLALYHLEHKAPELARITLSNAIYDLEADDVTVPIREVLE